MGRDSSGRWYQDHYKVVVDCDRQQYKLWDQLLVQLKAEFNNWHNLLRWGTLDDSGHYRGYPSTSGHGNILEAMNCAVSVYDKHYIDRDLNKTGQNIILLNAGSGLFWVDRRLYLLTKQRMVDGGIGCDIICMTRPPLHPVPLFLFSLDPSIAAQSSPSSLSNPSSLSQSVIGSTTSSPSSSATTKTPKLPGVSFASPIHSSSAAPSSSPSPVSLKDTHPLASSSSSSSSTSASSASSSIVPQSPSSNGKSMIGPQLPSALTLSQSSSSTSSSVSSSSISSPPFTPNPFSSGSLNSTSLTSVPFARSSSLGKSPRDRPSSSGGSIPHQTSIYSFNPSHFALPPNTPSSSTPLKDDRHLHFSPSMPYSHHNQLKQKGQRDRDWERPHWMTISYYDHQVRLPPPSHWPNSVRAYPDQ